jgi:hypothetical protein
MQGHSDDKRSPGQPFKAPRAETWNGMVAAGNAYRAGLLSNGTPPPTRPRETDIIKLKNSSSGNRARGEILRIDGKAITDLSDEHIWLIGQAPLGDDYFGILKEPIEDGGIGRVQVSGCCMALIDIIDADHTRAKSVASEYLLESSDEGPIEILYAPSGTGELECVVRFGGSSGVVGGSILFGFELTADKVDPAKSVAAEFYILDGEDFGDLVETDTLYDPAYWYPNILAGTRGLCILQGGKYYAIQSPCSVEGYI